MAYICQTSYFYFLQVPIVPYGGATSIEGHTLAPNGGLCIDMSLMNVCLCILSLVCFISLYLIDGWTEMIYTCYETHLDFLICFYLLVIYN